MSEEVKVCRQVFGNRAFSGLTSVNLGAACLNQLLTVVRKGEAKQQWTAKDGKAICVKGKAAGYKGKPQVEISKPDEAETRQVSRAKTLNACLISFFRFTQNREYENWSILFIVCFNGDNYFRLFK